MGLMSDVTVSQQVTPSTCRRVSVDLGGLGASQWRVEIYKQVYSDCGPEGQHWQLKSGPTLSCTPKRNRGPHLGTLALGRLLVASQPSHFDPWDPG